MENLIDISNILFLDIETVPQHPAYENLDERFKVLWDKKAENIRRKDDDNPVSLYPRAGIYAEFGKIVCISFGYFRNDTFRVKSFYSHDEAQLLRDFAKLLNDHFSGGNYVLCGHNGKEFDFPFIARRMLINKIRLPEHLNIAGKKPWEIKHLDTMELWKFGDFKNYTSLDLLAAIFGIPSPKDDIDGSDVWRVYWQENDLERIKTYCQKDVVTLMQLMRSYMLMEILPDDDIVFV